MYKALTRISLIRAGFNIICEKVTTQQFLSTAGFEYSDLMKLKRMSNVLQPNAKKSTSKKDNAFISRYTSGMCFNFHPEDSNIYMAGTEDGHIHRCSCSYNEQVT